MRVLVLTGMVSTKYGSLERWLIILGRELESRGHQLALHYSSPPASTAYLEQLRKDGIELWVEGINPGRIASIRSYRDVIKKTHPEVVLSMFSSKSIYAAATLGFLRNKNLWLNHLEMPGKRWLSSVTYSTLNALATVYAVSHAVRSQMEDSGFSSGRVNTWYLGLPIELIDVDPTRVIQPKPHRIVSVAHDRAVKGNDLLFRAFAQVLKEVPSARLVQVGIDPDESTELLLLARELGISDSVEWRGIVDGAYEEIALASIYVQPSRSEAFGLSALEAEYFGRPVVAFRVGGLPEAVLHGETGLLAEPEDVDHLSRNIVSLLRDVDRSAQMGAAGRVLVENRFLSRPLIAEVLDSSDAFEQRPVGLPRRWRRP